MEGSSKKVLGNVMNYIAVTHCMHILLGQKCTIKYKAKLIHKHLITI